MLLLTGGGYSAVAPSVAKAMEAGFLPVGVVPAPTRSGPQVTNQGYPGPGPGGFLRPWVIPVYVVISVFKP